MWGFFWAKSSFTILLWLLDVVLNVASHICRSEKSGRQLTAYRQKLLIHLFRYRILHYISQRIVRNKVGSIITYMLNYSEAGHGRQILAGLIDASLSSAFVITLYVFKGPELLYRTLEAVNGSLLVLMVFGFYRLLSLSFFNQTLGMRLFRLVLLNGEEQPLTYLEKTMAAIFILFRGTTYYHVK